MHNKTQIKSLGSVYLYNMLQDFRHLLIFDFRSNFQSLHIRDSFNVLPGKNREQIREVIELAIRKANQKQQKYKSIQPIRRYFFVGQQKLNPNDEGVQYVYKILAQYQTKIDKYYILSQKFQDFAKNYHFMLVDQQKLKQLGQKDKKLFQKALLYPYAKFPAQIIPKKLYLSGFASSNSSIMLKDLQITGLVDLIQYKQDLKMAEFKTNYQQFLHMPISRDVPMVLDFDVLSQRIDELVQKGRTLIYCRDGQSVSPAFVIAYLMWKTKLDVSMATLKVCQAISRVEIDKNIYTQLLLYKPKIIKN